MPPEHDLLGLVGEIYEASFDPSQWCGFLSLLAAAARLNRRNGNEAKDSGAVS